MSLNTDGYNFSVRQLTWNEIKKYYLPDSYSYELVKLNDDHSVTFRVDVGHKSICLEWLGQFKRNTKWVLRRSHPKSIHHYKADFTCCHNTWYQPTGKKKYKNVKNTNCPSKLTVTVRKLPSISLQKPTVCTMHYFHNHQTENAAALGANRVSAATEKQLKEIIDEGCSPAVALHKYVSTLPADAKVLADRSQTPDYKYVNHLYNKMVQANYGKCGDQPVGLLEKMQKKLGELHDAIGEGCLTTDGELVFSFATPVMVRAHTLSESGDICFLDSSGGMDGDHVRIFLLNTTSAAGGVTLGENAEKYWCKGLHDNNIENNDARHSKAMTQSPTPILHAEILPADQSCTNELKSMWESIGNDIFSNPDMYMEGVHSFYRNWKTCSSNVRVNMLFKSKLSKTISVSNSRIRRKGTIKRRKR